MPIITKIHSGGLADNAIGIEHLSDASGVGDKYHKIPVYADDAARNAGVGSAASGMIIFNTSQNALQQYTGTEWASINVSPSISSTSGTINEDTNTTLTVNGSAFVTGMTVKLVVASSGADVSGHTNLSYTLVSS